MQACKAQNIFKLIKQQKNIEIFLDFKLIYLLKINQIS